MIMRGPHHAPGPCHCGGSAAHDRSDGRLALL